MDSYDIQQAFERAYERIKEDKRREDVLLLGDLEDALNMFRYGYIQRRRDGSITTDND